MNLKLKASSRMLSSSLQITGSKSETNRLLLLKALYPEISLKNISDSDDATFMVQALNSQNDIIDVHHAGTAMRFLTAYFAIQRGREVILTGSSRMKERPIGILVDALKKLGSNIQYIEKEGYPPLKIKGVELTGNEVSINADVSSQFITALLLIAPKLKNGLTLNLEGDVTSQPYINMTVNLLRQMGITVKSEGNHIRVKHQPVLEPITIVIESDWSSASYYYSLIALANKGSKIQLSSYSNKSLQGDSALVDIYRQLGVSTVFINNSIILTKMDFKPEVLNLDLNNTPDIAQTIAVTCFGLGVECRLIGLHTLKIKETDRLEALKKELEKFGAKVTVTNDSLIMLPSSEIKQGVAVETYNDHRMAMAFAPLALKISLIIKDAGVVSKSYPSFWDDINKLGINTEEL